MSLEKLAALISGIRILHSNHLSKTRSIEFASTRIMSSTVDIRFLLPPVDPVTNRASPYHTVLAGFNRITCIPYRTHVPQWSLSPAQLPYYVTLFPCLNFPIRSLLGSFLLKIFFSNSSCILRYSQPCAVIYCSGV